MFRSILSSFARSYGRQLGRTAARRTAWLAIPILMVVGFLGVLEMTGNARILGPMYPTLMHLVGK